MAGILVLGGSGFIGSHLINNLRKDNKVVSLDIKEASIKHDGVEYLIADVRNLSELELPFEIDRIYNFAAIHTTPGHETHEYYETNILGALEATKLAERYNINEIVFTSSISVYGPGEDLKTEESTLKPESAYGFSKMLAERIHKAWHDKNPSSKLVIVRPAVVFGPREGGNFCRLAKLLKKGIFIYPGRKDTIKSCIFVEDLLFLIEEAIQSGRFTLFNGAYEKRYTIEDIINAFISKHFPHVKRFTFPYPLMVLAAKIIGIFNIFNIGIHPERILKLVRSTNVYPGWSVKKGYSFDNGLEVALQKWSDATNRDFS